jgi:DNA repair protein RadC
MRLKEMVVRERPRERLRAVGAAALSEAELLALLLRTGNKGENVLGQASRLLSQYGLDGLSRASVAALRTSEGLGVAKASQIVAAFELARRLSHRPLPKICSAAEAALYCMPLIGHLEQEHFLVVWLDVRNQVLGHEVITKGLVDSSLVHPREVFRGALKANASSVIVAHNHPSGDLQLLLKMNG